MDPAAVWGKLSGQFHKKIVYLLAGLPESYDVLVTALESESDTVPALESVTERFLREEKKLKDREEVSDSKQLLR